MVFACLILLFILWSLSLLWMNDSESHWVLSRHSLRRFSQFVRVPALLFGTTDMVFPQTAKPTVLQCVKRKNDSVWGATFYLSHVFLYLLGMNELTLKCVNMICSCHPKNNHWDTDQEIRKVDYRYFGFISSKWFPSFLWPFLHSHSDTDSKFNLYCIFLLGFVRQPIVPDLWAKSLPIWNWMQVWVNFMATSVEFTAVFCYLVKD